MRGVSLLEVLIVVALLGILAAFALPSFTQVSGSSAERGSAAEALGALREARSLAMGANLEHRVVFDLAASSWEMQRGNRPRLSSSFAKVSGGSLSAALASGADCSQRSGSAEFRLSGSGAGSGDPLCVLRSGGTPRFVLQFTSPTLGRLQVQDY